MSEYQRPIQLPEFQNAIKESSDEQLNFILRKLQLALKKLQDSNQLMNNLINKKKIDASKIHRNINLNIENNNNDHNDDDDDDDDDEFDPVTEDDIKLYSQCIKENDNVIQNQLDRIQIVKDELKIRNLPFDNDESNKVTISSLSNEKLNTESNNSDLIISTDNDDI